jgi:putative membrane protein
MVIGMTGFHEFLKACMKDFQNGQNKRSGRFFRMANEAPTIAMVVIVIMVVVRPF